MGGNMEQLEREVLRMLLAGDDWVLANLRTQLNLAERSRRRKSGVGFFTDFDVPEAVARLPGNPSIRFGDVIAEIEGLQHGAGFVLFVSDGVLTVLEGYTYDEPWPQKIGRYHLKYDSGGTRDFGALRCTPGWP